MKRATSRLPGFNKLSIDARLRQVAESLSLDGDALQGLGQSGSLPLANADGMIENAVGVLGLPVGLALNFLVNGEELLVPWRWRSRRSSPPPAPPPRSRATRAGSPPPPTKP